MLKVREYLERRRRNLPIAFISPSSHLTKASVPDCAQLYEEPWLPAGLGALRRQRTCFHELFDEMFCGAKAVPLPERPLESRQGWLALGPANA